MSSTICLRASKRSSPAYLPAAAVILPSKPMTVRTGSPWRRPISKSIGIVAGRDLDDAGAELGVDRLVGDDRTLMVPSTDGISSVWPTYCV